MSFDLSINFSEMWRRNEIPTQSIKVVQLQDLALLYELEDFIAAADETVQLEQDIDLFFATKPKYEVFYYAVTLVIKRAGLNWNDRFFEYSESIPLHELKNYPVTRKPIYNSLDSLYGLLRLSYMRCHRLFQHLSDIENKKQYFLEVVKIFTAVYAHLQNSTSERETCFHTKALLTTLNRQITTKHLRRYFH
jgi:hypothetical protein